MKKCICILLIMLCLGFASCDSKVEPKEVVVIEWVHSDHQITLTKGTPYRIFIECTTGNGQRPFHVVDAPEGSVVMMQDGKSYLNWLPIETGRYMFKTETDDKFLSQVYQLDVVKE